MRSLVGGWCPRHDRVYEKADRCPECGTTLVPLQAEKTPPTPQEHRSVVEADVDEPVVAPPPNPWIGRLAVAAAIVTAFLLGLIFPRGQPETLPVLPGTRAAATTLTPVQARAGAANGEIEMRSLTQNGERITADFRTVAGFPDPRRIEGAAIDVTTDTGSVEATFGLSETNLVSDSSGFTITGRLDAPGTVASLRITSIQVRAERSPEWQADLSTVLPLEVPPPSILRIKDEARRMEEGTIRLTTILGWTDRVEAVFELRGFEGAPGFRSELVGVDMLVTPPGSTGNMAHGRSISASQIDQVTAGEIIARFESVPDDAGTVTIRASRVLNFLEGPWTWLVA